MFCNSRLYPQLYSPIPQPFLQARVVIWLSPDQWNVRGKLLRRCVEIFYFPEHIHLTLSFPLSISWMKMWCLILWQPSWNHEAPHTFKVERISDILALAWHSTIPKPEVILLCKKKKHLFKPLKYVKMLSTGNGENFATSLTISQSNKLWTNNNQYITQLHKRYIICWSQESFTKIQEYIQCFLLTSFWIHYDE